MNRFNGNDTRALELKKIRRARSLRLCLAIIAVTVVGNAAAYLVYASVNRPVPPRPKPEAAQETSPQEGLRARAHRLAGLEAMAEEDYELAITELSAALKAPHPHEEVERLLSLVRELQEQASQRAPVQEVATQPEPARIEAPAGSVAENIEPKPESETLILVTTVPDGLIVKVNGDVQGVSPTRIEVEPGKNVVAIFQGDRRLMRKGVNVKDGSAMHVNVDLRKKVRPRGSTNRRGSGKGVDPEDEADEGPRRPRLASVADDAYAPVPASRRSPDEEADDLLAPDTPPVPRTEPKPSPEEQRARPPERETPKEQPPKKRPPLVPEPEDAPKKRLPAVPPAVLKKVIDRQGRRIRACYRAQLRRQLDLEAGLTAGRVVIHLVVSRDGAVQEGRIKSSTLKNERVERCIENVVRKLDFPPLKTVAEATFAMRFGPD